MKLVALCASGLLASSISLAALADVSLEFETTARISDRIAIGTVHGVGSGSVRVQGGAEIVLGIKEPDSGLVFTPCRVRVNQCLFDTDDSCPLEEIELLVPGGTVYENVQGQRRLRTWEVAGGMAAPLPRAGEDVLFFMKRHHGRYVLISDRVAPAPADVDQLKTLIQLARKVPTPPSGNRHAIPDRADPRHAHSDDGCDLRLRAGKDSQRGHPALDLGNDCSPVHRPDDGRRADGP